MGAEFSAEEILEITGGRLALGLMPESYGAIATDTRVLAEGEWYLALSGEKFDGHEFIGDAFAAGACGCIVAERPTYAIASGQFPLIAVADTLRAYHDLARNWRKRINPRVVAITGSSGKTTTKEMCAAVCSAGFKTHKSQANENNEFGVPKTILSMPDDTEALVVELAMRGLGEISLLVKMVLPDVAIIVNAGVAHLGPLATIENIIQAKCELLEELDARGGVAIVGQPRPALMSRVAQVYSGKTIAFDPDGLKELSVTPASTTVQVGPARFEVKAHGLSQLQDAWCAITAGRELGLDDAIIARGLRLYAPIAGRGARLVSNSGALVVDESYNANPDSVRSAVEAFVDARVFPQKYKYAVLGEMAELGDNAEEIHHVLGQWLADRNLSLLITVGAMAGHIADGAQGAGYEVLACQDKRDAEQALFARLNKDCCVLIKGSHCAALHEIVLHMVPNDTLHESPHR